MNGLSKSIEELIFSDEKIEKILLNEDFFSWLNIGTTDITISNFLDFLKNNRNNILPPRSGHIGNWEAILQGKAGMMDFNNLIVKENYGYPLIYCFNQTEDRNLEMGDIVYLPGSLIDNGKRVELDLYTLDIMERKLIKRNRENCYFTPFTFTKVGNEFISLIELHFRRLKGKVDFTLKLEPQIIMDNLVEYRKILKLLLTESLKKKNPESILQHIFSHKITLDGEMSRTKILYESGYFYLGEDKYNMEDLIETSIIPFLAANNPKKFLQLQKGLPPQVPLISNMMIGIFTAVFELNLVNVKGKDLNIHYHWGARDMAGYPPFKNGYFSSKSHRKSYKRILEILVTYDKNIKPIYFVIIPAVVFSLCPSNMYQTDSAIMKILFNRIKNLSLTEDIILEVERWYFEYQNEMSDYFKNKFKVKSGILQSKQYLKDELDIYEINELEEFRELTFRQACVAVGMLHKLIQAKEVNSEISML
ncbi:DUF6025 family protein [Lysinibacillus xylanilyticus]|uniref:DUF6025 family protein n=1 Tax=Lysinibacillus xylanilyticus TaxID=582475 RepID=UPI003D033D0A